MEFDVILPTNGVLKKWTNFVGGWQDRYFEILGGNLLYYKTKTEKAYGCRGSIFLKNSIITQHEFDECEFTVSVGSDVIWYMKAENAQSKLLWMRSLARESNDSDYSSSSTKSHSRNPSLSSIQITNEKLDDIGQLFTSKIAELEAYRTISRDQMASLERLLEKNEESVMPQSTLLSIKATHLALMVNINHIIDIVKSGKVSIPSEFNENCNSLKLALSPSAINNNVNGKIHTSRRGTATKMNGTGYASDDTQTTTKTLRLSDEITSECDEWHDADDYDTSIEDGEEAVERTPSAASNEENHQTEQENDASSSPARFRFDPEQQLPFGHYDNIEISNNHTLFTFVEKLANDQLKYALAGVEDNVWTLFAEDGAMKMYTREVEDGGLPVDPLKAVHHVKGVTALEYMHYFFDARYKKDWDHTLDAMKIVENVASDTVVLHQKHKTVWPAASRESLFVSHVRRMDNFKRDGAHDLYIVCNRNVERDDVPLSSSSAVRVGLTVSMVCETIVSPKAAEAQKLTRDDVACNIIYVSQVHPGGWVPTAALRHVYRKEYPRFLRNFTEYVVKNVSGKLVAI